MGNKVSTIQTIRKVTEDEAHQNNKDINDPDDNQSHQSPLSQISEHCDFPFFTDLDTITYISESKTLIIMKGLPGSGKSYIARNIQEIYKQSSLCSADSYFYEDGNYVFDFKKLGAAHNSCKTAVLSSIEQQTPLIIVDNTNVRFWEMKFYITVARKFHYNILIIEPKTPWRFDASLLAEKNSHGVDITILRDKVDLYEPITPLYYAWFLNDIDSLFLLKMGKCWLDRLMSVDEYCRSLQNVNQTNKDAIQYFSGGRKKLSGIRILHCTSMYTARNTNSDSDYMTDETVQKSIGRVYELKVTGFVVTPRTFGARVELTEPQLELWGKRDDTGSKAPSRDNLRPPSDIHTVPIPEYQLKETDITTNATLKVVHDNSAVGGSTAHVTLGCSAGVSSVQTGHDLKQVLELEAAQCLNEKHYQQFTIPGATVKHFGDGTWVIYPNKTAVFKALFAFEV